MAASSFKGHEIPTPAWVVDLDRMVANCERMLERARGLGVSLRPHVKTHKSVPCLLLQHLGRGALAFIDVPSGRVDVQQLLAFAASPECPSSLFPLRCCASTLGEAEHFLASGVPLDLCLAVPCGGDPVKMARLDSLALRRCQGRSRLRLVVDSLPAVQALLRPSSRRTDGRPWDVYLHVDCGYHREGALPELVETEQLLQLLSPASSSASAPLPSADPTSPTGPGPAAPGWVRLCGVYTHAGHSYGSVDAAAARAHAAAERDGLAAFAQRLRERFGMEGLEVAVGSTPTCSNPPEHLRGVTELHPGNYVYYDLHQAAVGSCAESDIAGAVLAAVAAAYPSRGRLLVDAGALAFSKDPGATHLDAAGYPARGWGVSPDAPDLRLVSISQEMGVLAPAAGSPQAIDFARPELQLGSRLRFYTHHSCLSAACFSEIHIVSGPSAANLQLLGVWPCSPRQW